MWKADLSAILSVLFLFLQKLPSDSVLQWLLRVCLIVVLAIHGSVAESFEIGIAVGQSDHLLDIGVLSFDLSVGKSDHFPVTSLVGDEGIGYLLFPVVQRIPQFSE